MVGVSVTYEALYSLSKAKAKTRTKIKAAVGYGPQSCPEYYL